MKIFFITLLTLLFVHSGYGEELKCPFQISDGSIFKSPGSIQVIQFAFQIKPIIGSHVLVIPYPAGKTVKLKVVSAEYQEYPELKPFWSAKLEDGNKTSLKNLKPYLLHDYISYAAVIWPVPAHGAKVIKVVPADLPPNVYTETTQVAIDLDNDKKADALLVEFGGNRRVNPRKTPTDYSYGETWQKVKGQWVLCDSFAGD